MAGTNTDFYSLVQRRIWNDAGFRRLSKPAPNARDLFLYLLTNPHATQIPGLVALGESAMAEDLEWPLAGLRKALAELETVGMVKVDRAARLLWLPNGMKHNAPKSPDNVLGWAKHWRMLPECDLLREAAAAMMLAFSARKGAFALNFSSVSGEPIPAPTPVPTPQPEVAPTHPPMGTPLGIPPPPHQIQDSYSYSGSDPPYPPQAGGVAAVPFHPTEALTADAPPPPSPAPRTRPKALGLPGVGVEAADDVFGAHLAAWSRVVGRGSPPVLDDKRRRRVRYWTQQGYTADQLRRAAAGIFDSEWHTSAENRSHLTFEVALRDAGQIEKFANLFDGANRASEQPARPLPEPPPPRPVRRMTPEQQQAFQDGLMEELRAKEKAKAG